MKLTQYKMIPEASRRSKSAVVSASLRDKLDGWLCTLALTKSATLLSDFDREMADRFDGLAEMLELNSPADG